MEHKEIMDKNHLHKWCMGVINQLYDQAEVPVAKRQSVNDSADKYLMQQIEKYISSKKENMAYLTEPEVPISDMYLIENGFVVGNGDTFNSNFYLRRHGSYTFAINPDNGTAWIMRMEKDIMIPKEIKYVHELHSFYLAFFGYEFEKQEVEARP